MDARRSAPATLRNREPILEVLRRFVPSGARVLEIAAGSGEHACFFAARLPVAEWQPTDPDPDSRASIDAWRTQSGVAALRPALALDVTADPWPVAHADAVVCINMIHISPWAATQSLMRGAARVLEPRGALFLYGPYRRFGAHTSASNEAFDASLRARDPLWGVRDLEEVTRVAEGAGLMLEELVAMPANNFSVVFRQP
ncbi:MAG: class I SAM-dependent methyltransferase [Polyangiaceae bacterium]|nr:class I SAM-dependent methyltransferase [Polyangiaceae bacterium]